MCQRFYRILFIWNISLVVAFSATCFTNYLILELDRSIKKLPIGIKENSDTFWDIDALRLTLCSYFASAITFDTRLIKRNDTRSFWRLPGFRRLFLNSTLILITFLITFDIYFVVVALKTVCTNVFLKDTREGMVNLKAWITLVT